MLVLDGTGGAQGGMRQVMLCVLYVIAVGTCLAIVGVLVERALPATAPRRWVWCVIIPISLIVPGFYRFHHTAAVAMATSLASDPGWVTLVKTSDPIISWLSLMASCVLVVWGLGNAWWVSRVVSRSRSERGRPGAPETIDSVPVVVTDSVGPATVGVWRSHILVPRWVLGLPGAQRQYVVRHEEEHRKSQDARLLFAMSLTLLLAPWNLALWWQLRRLRLAVEMDCDNRVVAGLGNVTAYGELLLKVAKAASRGPRLQPALLGTGMLERRLISLMAPTQLRHVQRALLSAVAVAIVLMVLSMPHPVLAGDSGAHVAMTTGR